MSSREGAVCITYTECASWTHSPKTVLLLTTERRCSLTAQVSSLQFECIQLKDGCVPVCANLAATIDPDEPSSKILRKTARTSEFSALTPWSADRTPWCHENAAQVSLSPEQQKWFSMVFASGQPGSFMQVYIPGEESILGNASIRSYRFVVTVGLVPTCWILRTC